MKRSWTGRRTILTGASSGIGRAIAVQIAGNGAKVALASRSADRLREVAREIESRGGTCMVVPTDITQPDQRAALFERVQREWGGLDLLINNAGIGAWGHFATSSESILRQVMEVNFYAPIEMIRLAIPLLERGQQAAIANVTSMCARRGMPAWPEYSASKFGLMGLSESLRGEMSRFDIDVLTMVPGLTQTDLQEHLIRKDGRYPIDASKGMPVAKVAETIVRSIEKNQRETVIGGDARWMLFINRFFPRLLDRLIAKRITKLYAQEASAPATTTDRANR
ncbi:SDR family oxidoreductase [Tuwongella immobilis]|uniref:Uncharacterized protein n=1 Tax=Tuwongella immobilis TaxID=692036 RepID=A0A6C2YTC0_9BACT|nr:SDR family oxidoreductase [Tuwongella immobilis]VIP04132.1 short-chain dehydrogenase : Oxidoreductase, short-chain dehydrogenase/reductase family protein OS=uncultured planctomycete GN=HGMM_F13D05C11 PE=3 SV=1: adh_short [Tuwongella immobilis]VTS05629.1 short-chain dehydrogenase : Oxidoreductase, short-chain dehydrogenase/reductase family protein OS=uncultured planctomycete GN=HGMM_F13D05C11 PE=3 SV=1: adh_short [Tuwongella immobilis]